MNRPRISTNPFNVPSPKVLHLYDIHLPPPHIPEKSSTHLESVNFLEHSFGVWLKHGPVLGTGDWNSRYDEIPSSIRSVATRVGAEVSGSKIDASVHKYLMNVSVEYVSQINGVPLRSDHGHAIRTNFQRWAFGRHHHVISYNLRVGRREDVVYEELRALLTRQGAFLKRPLAVCLQEAATYDLPEAVGYSLIRDTSIGGRANLAMYVRNDHLVRYKWYDMELTWKRTDHPGTHPARSYLRADVLM